MKAFFRYAVVFAATLSAAACSKEAKESISANELRMHVEYLASDALGGRFTGTAGVAAAEDYIAGEFARIGLLPLPEEEDYFLDFELDSASFDSSGTFLNIDESTFFFGKDFKPFPFSSEGEISAPVVFAGYGITAPEYDYDDYKNLDVEGKIVIVMRHEPDEAGTTGRFDGKRHTTHAYFRTKAENALAHGAIGMLLYTDPLHHDADDDLRIMPVYAFTNDGTGDEASAGARSRFSGKPVAEGFVAFHISRSAAGALLPGKNLVDLQKEVDSGSSVADLSGGDFGPSMVQMGQRVDFSGRRVQARNVAGFLPGRQKGNGDWILIGAHHDHIGSFEGEGDTIYNGADDNASGVAGVIELAEQFASNPPERSMVFLTFSAEEIGLFGSYALEKNDLLDLGRIGFMLNLDMIGRNPGDSISVYGDGLAAGLTDLVIQANEKPLLDLDLRGKEYEPFSDIAVFHDNRVPFLMMYTGEHADYHGIADHAEKLDFSRMEKLVRLSYDILDLVADADEFPDFEE
jgi:hypothetical protein